MKRFISYLFICIVIFGCISCEEVSVEPEKTPTPTLEPIIPTEEYGDGSDGILEVDTFGTIVNVVCSKLTNTPSSGEVSLTLEDATGFNAGDEVFIHTAQGIIAATSGPGVYEFGMINSIVGTTVILIDNLSFDYVAGDITFVYLVPNYRSVSIHDGASIQAHPWNPETGGGVVVFRSALSINISASGKIDVSGMGYRGPDRQEDDGSGLQGEGYPGVGVTSTSANGNGGGGAIWGPGYIYSGGGGGGHAYAGLDGDSGDDPDTTAVGFGGEAVGNIGLSKFFFGGAGGTGADNDGKSSTNPNGGNGGGIIYIAAPDMTLMNVMSNGGDGNFSVSQDGGAGGGAGGSIYVLGDTVNIIGNVTALGGEGFLPQDLAGKGGKGGNGSAGRIRIVAEEINGSTSPKAYTD